MACQRTKCEDYLTDGGEPHWCHRIGCPATVAAAKCPKAAAKKGSVHKDRESTRQKVNK